MVHIQYTEKHCSLYQKIIILKLKLLFLVKLEQKILSLIKKEQYINKKDNLVKILYFVQADLLIFIFCLQPCEIEGSFSF